MAKRQHLTVGEVLETMQMDFEDDLDETMMEGSNDELSDLEMSDSDNCKTAAVGPDIVCILI